MVNNTTNAIKTNNYLSLQLTEHKSKDHVLAWARHNYAAGKNRLMGSEPSHHDNWISKGNTCINKRQKTCPSSLSLKKARFVYKYVYECTNP